ncbi:hypothetical protein [Tsuneonella sp. HG222]
MTPLNHIPDGGKHALDALAALTVVGAFAQILPPIAAGLSIIWLALQIFGWCEARWFKPKD